MRRVFGIRKVGHAGTLDPLATGVLVVLVGKATKLSQKLVGQEKEYLIGISFGRSTETGDAEGSVTKELEPHDRRLLLLTAGKVEEELVLLKGTIKQKVPAFSAVKVGGIKLYEAARKGKKVVRPSRQVKVKELKLKDFELGTDSKYPFCTVFAVVSAGTYTRSLVEELRRKLKVPAHQISLVRTRSGNYSLDQALNLPQLEEAKDPKQFLTNTYW